MSARMGSFRPVNPSLLKLRLKRRPKAAGVPRSDTAVFPSKEQQYGKAQHDTERIFTDPQININTLMQILRDLKKRLRTLRWKLLIWCVRNAAFRRTQPPVCHALLYCRTAAHACKSQKNILEILLTRINEVSCVKKHSSHSAVMSESTT